MNASRTPGSPSSSTGRMGDRLSISTRLACPMRLLLALLVLAAVGASSCGPGVNCRAVGFGPALDELDQPATARDLADSPEAALASVGDGALDSPRSGWYQSGADWRVDGDDDTYLEAVVTETEQGWFVAELSLCQPSS